MPITFHQHYSGIPIKFESQTRNSIIYYAIILGPLNTEKSLYYPRFTDLLQQNDLVCGAANWAKTTMNYLVGNY